MCGHITTGHAQPHPYFPGIAYLLSIGFRDTHHSGCILPRQQLLCVGCQTPPCLQGVYESLPRWSCPSATHHCAGGPQMVLGLTDPDLCPFWNSSQGNAPILLLTHVRLCLLSSSPHLFMTLKIYDIDG